MPGHPSIYICVRSELKKHHQIVPRRESASESYTSPLSSRSGSHNLDDDDYDDDDDDDEDDDDSF